MMSLGNDEILQGWKWATTFVVVVSILLALAAGIMGGWNTYRQSAEPRAARRLFSSVFAGLGFGILFTVIGIIAGILIDGVIFLPIDYSFGESAFSFVILIPILTGIVFGLIGVFLGTAIIYHMQRPKNKIPGMP